MSDAAFPIEPFLHDGYLDHPFLECYVEEVDLTCIQSIIQNREKQLRFVQQSGSNVDEFISCFRRPWVFFALGLWEGPRDNVFHQRLGIAWKDPVRRHCPSADFWGLVGRKEFHVHLMSIHERELLQRMPAVVQLYRASYSEMVIGASWTTNLGVARSLATRMQSQLKVLSVTVETAAILAVFEHLGYLEVMVDRHAVENAMPVLI